jgi:hypothetical protein
MHRQKLADGDQAARADESLNRRGETSTGGVHLPAQARLQLGVDSHNSLDDAELRNRAEVAEWQTRRTQNPVLARGCGFKSHLRYYPLVTIQILASMSGGDARQRGRVRGDAVLRIAVDFAFHSLREPGATGPSPMRHASTVSCEEMAAAGRSQSTWQRNAPAPWRNFRPMSLAQVQS